MGKRICLPRLYVGAKEAWHFGNEYRDAGCAESDIIWQVELREGKDHPQHLGNKEIDDKGKTVGTLLCLT